jgi:hypothetical protein
MLEYATKHGIDKELDQEQSNLIFQHILDKINVDEINKRKGYYIKVNKSLVKIAAIFIVGASLFYFSQNTSLFSNKDQQKTIPVINESAITLTLDDGTVKEIHKEGAIKVTNAKGEVIGTQNRSTITYTNSEDFNTKASNNELVYNTLTVPLGERFSVVLEDGTQVFLNAGTKVRYPTAFTNPQSREVYVDGEAYFEVKTKKDHPFIVHTEAMSVQALGTKFNVSSYKNENNTSTVLVEGSIAVFKPEETYHKEKHLVIKPSQQAIFNNDLFTVKKVNIKKHIAWVNGELYFINDCFENIMKELERHYNIIIENRHKDLSNVRYTGTFDEKDTIEQVLNTFLRNTNFKYSYKNKRHIIIDPNLENSQGDKPTKNN